MSKRRWSIFAIFLLILLVSCIQETRVSPSAVSKHEDTSVIANILSQTFAHASTTYLPVTEKISRSVEFSSKDLNPLGKEYYLYPMNFPSIYIAIDESLSLNRDLGDGINKCDPDKNRYKIPLFLLKLLNRWQDEDLFEHDFNTTLAYLANGMNSFESPISRVDNEDYWGLERKILEEEYFSKMLYEQLFGEIMGDETEENKQVIFFTDGELSDIGDRDFASSIVDKAEVYELMGKLSNILMELSRSPNVAVRIFLLCPDRLDHAQKTWWAGVGTIENVNIYGLDDSEVLELRIKNLISDLLSVSTGFFDDEWIGWGIINSRKSETIEINGIPPNAQVINWSVFSVDTKSGDEIKFLPALMDGVKYSNGELIWPLEQCENHHLEIDIDEQSDGMYFYWWYSEPIDIVIDLDGTNALLVNNSNTSISDIIQYTATLSDNKQRELKWGKLERCYYGRLTVEDFQTTFEISDLLGERRVLMLEQEVHSPFKNLVPDGYQSELVIELVHKITSVPVDTVLIPLDIRYKPVLREIVLDNQDSSNLTSQIVLNFDYLSPKYYPGELLANKLHQPRISFLDNGKLVNKDCPFKQESYYPGIDNEALFFDVVDNDVLIEISKAFATPSDEIRIEECKTFTLLWEDWPGIQENWEKPIDIVFELEWDCDGTACVIAEVSQMK